MSRVAWRAFGRAVLLAALGVAGPACFAQTCASPGLDGPVAASGVVNTYHSGSGSVSAGANVVFVASTAGQRSNTRQLRAGDMVIVIQMQDSSDPSKAGIHEYAQIQSVSGTAITLRAPLLNGYAQSVTSAGVRTFQVVWVPQYASLTISGTARADRWWMDSSSGRATGGVFAVDVAGEMTLAGTIDAAGAGFRGGGAFSSNYGRGAGAAYDDLDYPFNISAPHGGMKGEGIAGTPPMVFDGAAGTVIYYPPALLGQGYPSGAEGRAPRANAGGGGNDGNPSNANPPGGGSNEYNSGGGGGSNGGAGGRGGNSWNANTTGGLLNLPAGGNTGNEAGGIGGVAVANSASRLVMGGGGGAGGANNAVSSNSISAWPPTASAGANGASGAITSSGAPGGGLVLVRAAKVGGSGTIDASGYRAYNKMPVGESDAAGGGGGGGTVVLWAASGGATGLNIRVLGGAGGSSNYYNHGPGGGGGGGYVLTNLAGATVVADGGANGVDACCGGAGGNASPKPYNATAGTRGTAEAIGAQPGVQPGASCLPQLAVVKATTTPLLIVPGATTAQYVVTITNPAAGSGTAYGVAVRDTLPTPFGLPGVSATASFAVSGGGTQFTGATSAVANVSGATPTAVFGTAGGMTGSFIIFPGGQVTLTFTVNLNSASAGLYQNPAAVVFTDPTRLTGASAVAANLPANPVVSPGQVHAGGQPVGGSNYASSSGTGEDVRIAGGSARLTLSKTNGVTTLMSGQTTTYDITVANLGPSAADGTVLKDPASAGLACQAVTCSVTGGAAQCPDNLNVSDLQSPGVPITSFPANSSLTFQLSCMVTASGL